MKIETLREYIVFAQYLNSSVAAKKLYISQSTLSKHMIELERELGLDLVSHGREMGITLVGNRFLGGLVDVIERYDALLNSCYELERQKPDTLRVYESFILSGGAKRLYEVLEQFERRHESCSFEYISAPRIPFKKALDEDTVDVGIDYSYVNSKKLALEVYGENYNLAPLLREKLIVWHHIDNELMDVRQLHIEDLKSKKITLSTSIAPPLKFAIEELCESRGFSPSFSYFSATTQYQLFAQINIDSVYILSSDIASNPLLTKRENMVFREFCEDDAAVIVYLVAKKNTEIKSLEVLFDEIGKSSPIK